MFLAAILSLYLMSLVLDRGIVWRLSVSEGSSWHRQLTTTAPLPARLYILVLLVSFGATPPKHAQLAASASCLLLCPCLPFIPYLLEPQLWLFLLSSTLWSRPLPYFSCHISRRE